MKGTFWTSTREAQLEQLAAQGLTVEKAATVLGCTRNAASGAAYRLGVKFGGAPDGYSRWSKVQDERMLELIAQGLTAAEVGEHLGKSRHAIRKRAQRMRDKFLFPAGNQYGTIGMKKKQYAPKPPKAAVASRIQEIKDAVIESVITMEEIEQHQCRYPVNNVHPFVFCPREQKHGPYCEDHWFITRKHESLSRL